MPLLEIAEAFLSGVAGEYPMTEAFAGLLGRRWSRWLVMA
jgi:hypothetical protein